MTHESGNKGRLIRSLIVFSVIFIASFITVFPYVEEGAIISAGESSFYLDPSYLDFLSVWENKFNFGSFSSHQPNYFLYVVLWKVFELLLSFVHPSVVFIFLSTFASALFFYICAKGILKIKSPLLYLPASLLYAFNAFRLIGPINERLNLLFIFLPLFFLFYYRLVHFRKWRYVFILVILSALSSSMGANLPVFSMPYLLMLLYLFYYFIFWPKTENKLRLIFMNVVLFSLILVVNLFWLAPLVYHLSQTFIETKGGEAVFSALDSGTFFDHFRFIGSWGWRSIHYIAPYYPFFTHYYDVPLLLTTYGVSIFSFLTIFSKKKRSFTFRYLETFSLLLVVLSLFLLAGSKGPFELIYNLLYRFLVPFRIYREPFTKFTSLFIFAVSFCLVFSLYVFWEKAKKPFIKHISVLVLSLLVLINAYPLFTMEAMPVGRWNGGQWGVLVKIPGYWKKAGKYFDDLKLTTNVLLSPFCTYGGSHNWPHGASLTGNFADRILPTKVIRGWALDVSPSGKVLAAIFARGRSFDLEKYLSLLNTKYVLQTNDIEWRYSNMIAPPSTAKKLLEDGGLKKVSEFGLFSNDHLRDVLNSEPDMNVKYELNVELLDKPALEVYELSDDYVTPLFYPAKKMIHSAGDFNEIRDVVSFNDYEIGSGIFLSAYQPPESTMDISKIMSRVDSSLMFAGRRSAAISLTDLLWKRFWPWPEVSIDPSSFLYKLALLKERCLALCTLWDVEKRVDRLIWFAAKRIAELEKFDVSEEMVSKLTHLYVRDLELGLNRLKKVMPEDRDSDFWGMVGKIAALIRRAEELNEDGVFDGAFTTLAKPFHEEVMRWVEDVANPTCGEFCYKLSFPTSEEYEVFTDSQFLDDLTDVTLSVESIEDGTQTILNPLPNQEETYWIDFGEFSFSEVVFYKFDLNFPHGQNLLGSGEWLPYEGVTDFAMDGLEFFPQDYITGYTYRYGRHPDAKEEGLPDILFWRDEVRFKPINGWEPLQKYKVSFDFRIESGGLGFVLLEDFPNFRGIYDKIKFGSNDFEILSKIKRPKHSEEIGLYHTRFYPDTCDDEGNCYHHFERIFSASERSLGAYLYLYAYPEVEEFSNVRITNVRVEKMYEPVVILKRTVTNPPRVLPEIEFEELSDISYKVRVTRATDPYDLVFSRSFHKFWDLKYQGEVIAKDDHYLVNGFANGWYVEPEDVGGLADYELTVEFKFQDMLDWAFEISAVVLISLSILVGLSYVKDAFTKKT